MTSEMTATLEDILSRWHHYCKQYSPVPVSGADPMFRAAVSPKGWDDTSDIADDAVHRQQMAAVDFAVSEMQDPYKAAIYIKARCCYTGNNSWLSPRLPQDPLERGVVVRDALRQLTKRLIAAGVLQ